MSNISGKLLNVSKISGTWWGNVSNEAYFHRIKMQFLDHTSHENNLKGLYDQTIS